MLFYKQFPDTRNGKTFVYDFKFYQNPNSKSFYLMSKLNLKNCCSINYHDRLVAHAQLYQGTPEYIKGDA